ncbi:MAG: SDR family oxidoreductase [Geminicoccaceae bacterium]
MEHLKARHAVVTGGGSGIGASIAVALAQAGALVTIAGRRAGPLEELAASNERIEAVTCDVTDEASVAALFEQANGRAQVDIVIANAGIAESNPFDRTPLEQWQRIMDINLTGVFLTLREGYRCMKGRDYGRLLAISSIAGVRGYGYVAPYCASKHGVVGLVRALAQETAGKGITANAICPGYAETPMLTRSVDNIRSKTGMSEEDARKSLSIHNPAGHFIQPEEVAAAALWLCGDDARSVTGQTITISGGDP